jgi:enolase-phosphatase E1
VIAALVLDIEGTTSPTRSVREVLYSYTWERIPDWLQANRAGPAAEILAATRQLAGQPNAGEDDAVVILRGWIDSDIKCDPLKTLQGLICHEGFIAGDLRGQFFPDVPPALRRWRRAGIRIYVYSSGSVRNQRDWFAFAACGRLDDLIDGHFDLSTAGSKLATESYQRITDQIHVDPTNTLFLSDSPAELDAAAAARWAVLGVARPDEQQEPVPPHRWIRSFDDLELAAATSVSTMVRG